MQSFIQSLQSSRDIAIVAGGEGAKPYYVQRHLLESSSEYFVKAFRNQHLDDQPEVDVLRFPEDDFGVWGVYVYWLYKGSVPVKDLGDDYEDQRLLVRCWALGDKLCIPDFQNQAMLALLRMVIMQSPSLDVVKEAVRTSQPKSGMRRLMAEEIVWKLENDTTCAHQLEDLDGCGILAQIRYSQNLFDGESFERGLYEDGKIVDYEQLNTYMEGGGLSDLNEA